MKNYVEEGVSIIIKEVDDDKSMLITLNGEMFIKSEKTEGELTNYFNEIYKYSLENNRTRITMDFLNLHSISSYGIRIIINWIKKLSEKNKKNNNLYHLIIIYNRKIEWQETTFLSLNEIFKDFVEYKEIQ